MKIGGRDSGESRDKNRKNICKEVEVVTTLTAISSPHFPYKG